MTSRWHRDMNPPEDPHRIEPVTCGHGKGCQCMQCAEHRVRLARAAAAIGHTRDEAAPDPGGPHEIPGMPPCICSRCIARRAGERNAAEAIEQARQDAAAYRERYQKLLYETGDDEYIMDETGPCYGITGPAVSSGQALLPGPGGIFAVTRVRQERPGVWVPDPDGDHQVAAAGGMTRDQAGQAEAAMAAGDPAAQIMLAITEPLGLDAGQLAAMAPQSGPGRCQGCHTPVADGQARCGWCAALHALNAQGARDQQAGTGYVNAKLARRALTCTHGKNASWIRDGRCQRCGRYAIRPAANARPALAPVHPRRETGTRIFLAWAGLTLLILAGHLWAVLIVPAVVCLWLALAGWQR